MPGRLVVLFDVIVLIGAKLPIPSVFSFSFISLSKDILARSGACAWTTLCCESAGEGTAVFSSLDVGSDPLVGDWSSFEFEKGMRSLLEVEAAIVDVASCISGDV